MSTGMRKWMEKDCPEIEYLSAQVLIDREDLDRLEAAEKERDILRPLVVMRFDHDRPPQFVQGYDPHELNEPVTAEHCRWFVAEIERLRSKIAEMEKQEPVAKVRVHRTGGNAGLAWSVAPLNDFDSLPLMRDGEKLYAIPGAQCGASVPDGWLPVPEIHPTFELVDLKLSDGSVLCGCLPQSDGDYWWKGPSGEVFIDPKYASVTHWRLAETPKPEGE